MKKFVGFNFHEMTLYWRTQKHCYNCENNLLKLIDLLLNLSLMYKLRLIIDKNVTKFNIMLITTLR